MAAPPVAQSGSDRLLLEEFELPCVGGPPWGARWWRECSGRLSNELLARSCRTQEDISPASGLRLKPPMLTCIWIPTQFEIGQLQKPPW